MSVTANPLGTVRSVIPYLDEGTQDGADPFSFDTSNQDSDASTSIDGGSLSSAAAFPTLAFNWQASSLWGSGYDIGGAAASGGTGSSASSANTTAGDEPSGGTVTVSSAGSGLVFVNTYDSSCTAAYEACIVAAEKQLESLLTSAVTLKVTFKESNEGDNGDALGNSWPTFVNVTYANLKAKLQSVDPDLPSTDPSGGAGFSLPEAYARMLGLSTSTPTVDDTVTLNDYYNWSYGQDIINGVTHELTEGGLGRVGGLGDQNGVWSTMDLFRVTSTGAPDYTDGRDGKTTYFASNSSNISSKGTPELSYNNEYNSSGTQVNTGDTADWNQDAVFGSTDTGETLTLNQTELNVMQALGWNVALPQDIMTASGNWQTPTDWTTGSMPIAPQDVFIGVLNAVTATSANKVTVNSIGTNTLSTIIVSANTLTATNGTVLNSETTSSLATGNLGAVQVDSGATLAIGNTFDNAGTMTIGYSTSNGGNGNLSLSGTVTLNGAGTLNLGNYSNQDFSTGSVTGGGLTNVNNSIAGGGSIVVTTFDNQASGKIEANQSEGNSLDISASTFTNEGKMYVEGRAEIDLGKDGASQSLANAGTIYVGYDGTNADPDADLAISGTFTLTGSGSVYMKGAGGGIISDGAAADTLINESTITALASGQIGDNGIYGGSVNDLTFENTGSTAADGVGVTLTLNTGGNTVADGGGTLEAEGDANLVIDSNVTTGEIRFLNNPPPGGTIEATSGGVVTDAAAISDGVSLPLLSVAGQVVISGGTFELLASGSVAVPIEFTGGVGALELYGTSAPAGAIFGLAVGDIFELVGSSISAYTIGASSMTITTDAATYDFGSVSYSGTITGFIAWADAATGLEKVTFTDGVATALSESGWTIYLANAPANVTGGSDTIVFVGSAAESVELLGTAGDWDAVSGANGTVTLTSAQASVFGSGDTVDFAGSDDAVSLYGTSPSWDVVSGSSGTVYLTSAQASIIGGSENIEFAGGLGNAASLYDTASGWDSVIGSGGTVYLTNAQTNIFGGGDAVVFAGGSGNAASLYNTNNVWDSVTGSGGTIYLTNAQTNISGGGDAVVFAGGSGDAASLYNTSNDWDSVTGSSGLVYLTSSQTNISGSLDTIDFSGGTGNAISIYGTSGVWDTVNGSNGTVYLTSAQASVIGAGDTIDLGGVGAIASLGSTGGTGDTVNGSSATVDLYSVIAKVTGSGDTVNFSGSDTANLIGGSDVLAFQAGIGGADFIKGFASSDVVQMSHSDFASFNALLASGDIKQSSGGNTIITLNSSDSIDLQGVTLSTLTSAQFNFV